MFFEAPPSHEQVIYFPASRGKQARLGMLREMSAIEYERYLDRTVDTPAPAPAEAVAEAGTDAAAVVKAPAIKARRFEGMSTSIVDRCLFFPVNGVDADELEKATTAARKQSLKAQDVLGALYYATIETGGERICTEDDMSLLSFNAVQKLVGVVSSWTEAATAPLKKD